MKKHLGILALAIFVQSAHAGKLQSFEEVLQAVNQGKLPTFVTHTDVCEHQGERQSLGINISGIWKPSSFLLVGNVLRTRGLTYSDNLLSAPEIGPVNQSYTWDFDSHNQLTIVNRFLDPVTWKEVAPAVTIICRLGKGLDIYA